MPKRASAAASVPSTSSMVCVGDDLVTHRKTDHVEVVILTLAHVGVDYDALVDRISLIFRRLDREGAVSLVGNSAATIAELADHPLVVGLKLYLGRTHGPLYLPHLVSVVDHMRSMFLGDHGAQLGLELVAVHQLHVHELLLLLLEWQKLLLLMLELLLLLLEW